MMVRLKNFLTRIPLLHQWFPLNSMKGKRDGLRRDAPLVPIDSSTGRSLSAVIAILTFLAALFSVGAELVATSSSEWQSSVSKEITVQVRPSSKTQLDDDVQKAAQLIQGTPGIAGVRIFSVNESEKLLEPWLGSNVNLKGLPIPRLIVVKLSSDIQPDLEGLEQQLYDLVPNAQLDNHNSWLSRLSTMANTVVGIGISIVLLVLTAAGLAVTFATRGAMDGNREVVEVLHFVGANDRYIAREFQIRFFQLGLRGSFYGSSLALILCLLLGFISKMLRATASGTQIEIMFGSFGVSLRGFFIVFGISILVAAITAIVSRWAVQNYLKETPR